MKWTYKRFLKENIDLSPCGIDPAHDFTPYFCTPRGMRVCGAAGVDGIHYGFVRGFGETVFSVSPMNGAPDYVHPVAACFSDLLRLLLACRDMHIIEQAWQWSEAQFDAAVADLPQDNMRETALSAIKERTGLLPLEEPYAYLQALRSRFPYDRIPYSSEMDEMLSDTPMARAFRVIYGGGFDSSVAGRAGKEMPIGRRFTWQGEEWLVPAVYPCGKGMVLDLYREIAPARMQAFYKTWQGRIGLSREERRRMRAENPTEIPFKTALRVNGTDLCEKSGHALLYLPQNCRAEDEENPKEAEEVLAHHKLDPTRVWVFHRLNYPWKTTKKPTVTSLSLSLFCKPTTLYADTFADPAVGETVFFRHPTTGRAYRLTVLAYERQALDHTAAGAYEIPAHHIAMQYRLDPPLSGTVFAVRDVAPSDPPRRIASSAAGDMFGIIGGADGPTAIFASPVPRGENIALSALHFSPPACITWQPEFREKLHDDMEVPLY